MLERKSPLGGHRILGKFGRKLKETGVTIEEVKDFSYIEIAFWDPESPSLRSKLSELLGIADWPGPAKMQRLKGGVLLRIAPDRIAYLGDSGPAEILEAAVAPSEGSVVALSHSRCYLRLGGAEVTNLLSRGLRLDLRDHAFPVGASALTEIHGLGVLLIRRDKAQYDLLFMRSTALNLWHWLNESAAQFGYEVL